MSTIFSHLSGKIPMEDTEGVKVHHAFCDVSCEGDPEGLRQRLRWYAEDQLLERTPLHVLRQRV